MLTPRVITNNSFNDPKWFRAYLSGSEQKLFNKFGGKFKNSATCGLAMCQKYLVTFSMEKEGVE